MKIQKKYVEVELDGLNELTGKNLFFKSMMERVPMTSKERIIIKPPLNGARIVWARLGYDV